ncbi:uncharacterized protein BO97DRAFT_418050 [Aspergillus homomorphus CBS 101889]|uniref:Uncharacterized protein n=1 Tax=Aspergillus homomorphus (strain CBS 101889) TaxID=1450537 RepID=A0A395HJW3_ASPHC|nr:hypothetical protein BO97DRAFT_418050 [Aspergillus homomorphus CBS 101889]RAL08060.1 hypothetical protein BO97DRAFT_418050 [Aspergillus homomorphus CBS 101889]
MSQPTSSRPEPVHDADTLDRLAVSRYMDGALRRLVELFVIIMFVYQRRIHVENNLALTEQQRAAMTGQIRIFRWQWLEQLANGEPECGWEHYLLHLYNKFRECVHELLTNKLTEEELSSPLMVRYRTRFPETDVIVTLMEWLEEAQARGMAAQRPRSPRIENVIQLTKYCHIVLRLIAEPAGTIVLLFGHPWHDPEWQTRFPWGLGEPRLFNRAEYAATFGPNPTHPTVRLPPTLARRQSIDEQSICPICQVEIGDTGREISLALCAACGIIFTAPVFMPGWVGEVHALTAESSGDLEEGK